MPKQPYRHGDVLLIPVDEVPVGVTLKQVARNEHEGVILAYGEATGHHHGIMDEGAVLYQMMLTGTTAADDRLLELARPATLRQYSSNPAEVEGVHLHAAIELPARRYIVRIQRQLEAGRGRQVTD